MTPSRTVRIALRSALRKKFTGELAAISMSSDAGACAESEPGLFKSPTTAVEIDERNYRRSGSLVEQDGEMRIWQAPKMRLVFQIEENVDLLRPSVLDPSSLQLEPRPIEDHHVIVVAVGMAVADQKVELPVRDFLFDESGRVRDGPSPENLNPSDMKCAL